MNTLRMKINFNMSPKAAKRPVWHDSVETQWHKCAELQVKTSRIQTWPGWCAVFLGKTLYSHSATVGTRECRGRLGRGVGGGGVVIPLATSYHLCTNNFTFVGFDHIFFAVDCHGVIQNLERASHWSIHQYPCMQYAGIPHSFLMSVFTAWWIHL